MGFQLSITIGGLCMLVHDPANKKVHVIVPAVGQPHDHPGHDPHETLLIGARAGLAAPHPLDDGILDLSGIATNAGVAPAIPSSVMDLRDVTGDPSLTMPRQFLDPTPRDARVAAHIVLSGGQLEAEKPACFIPRRGAAPKADSASLVTWKADVSAAGLASLPIAPLRSLSRASVPAVAPLRGHIWIGLVAIPVAFSSKPTGPEDLYHPSLEYTPDHFAMFLTFWSGVSGAPALCSGSMSFKSAFMTYPRICTSCWVPAA